MAHLRKKPSTMLRKTSKELVN